jgi:hypothetical protein
MKLATSFLMFTLGYPIPNGRQDKAMKLGFPSRGLTTKNKNIISIKQIQDYIYIFLYYICKPSFIINELMVN